MVFKMAAKKKAKKKVTKKANPVAVMKAKLAESKAKVSAINAEAKETNKRSDALVKAMAGGASAAPATKKKAKKKKKGRKKPAAKK